MNQSKKDSLTLSSAKEKIDSLQISNETMKIMNKELVLNLQRMKKEVADSVSQIRSLKAELYDMIVEKNSLMEKNIKLANLLRSSQQDSSSVQKMVDDLLIPRDSERSRLSPKQSAVICPMVSGHIIHNPKVELRRLNFCDYPNVVYAQENDAVCLSPVIEEPVQSRLGHRIQLNQNMSSMMNREVDEKSFYPVGTWSIENSNNLESNDSIDFNPSSSENNLPPSTSNESFPQPGSSRNDIKPKPSGSRFLADDNISSLETGRNSVSVTTINVVSPENDPQPSSIMLSPSVFVNVCSSSKRRYATELSANNGYALSEVKKENDENHDSNYTNIIKSKYPVVVFERLPAVFTETLTANISNANKNTMKEKKLKRSTKGKNTKSAKKTKVSTRSSSSVEGSWRGAETDSLGKRRSARNRKAVSYKE